MSFHGDIIFALNSCLNDIAAALLAVGLAVVRILSVKYPSTDDAAGADALLCVYKVVAWIIFYAFSVMVVTAAVMAVYPRRAGGPLSFGYPQVVAAAVKYGVMFILAGIGLFIWSGLSKKMGHLRSRHNL